MKKGIWIPIMAAVLIGGVAYAINYITTDTAAQRQLVSNPSNLDTVTLGMIANQTPAYQVDDYEGAGTNYYKRWRSGTGTVYIERMYKSGNIWTRVYRLGTWATRTNNASYAAVPR